MPTLPQSQAASKDAALHVLEEALGGSKATPKALEGPDSMTGLGPPHFGKLKGVESEKTPTHRGLCASQPWLVAL